jgi:hypothetical protein
MVFIDGLNYDLVGFNESICVFSIFRKGFATLGSIFSICCWSGIVLIGAAFLWEFVASSAGIIDPVAANDDAFVLSPISAVFNKFTSLCSFMEHLAALTS